jgi:hypothetical protein
MRKVERDDILDYLTYTDKRGGLRPAVLDAKRLRRTMVGEHLTFLFENHQTIWYQVQEMMRVERIVRETDIQREIDTYNELLGRKGELGICLLISILDEGERHRKLSQWLGLQTSLYLRLGDGTKVRPTWDPRQVGTDRLSSVQYLRFDVGGRTPVAAGCDFEAPEVCGETLLGEETRAALQEDLDS